LSKQRDITGILTSIKYDAPYNTTTKMCKKKVAAALPSFVKTSIKFEHLALKIAY
jgi:hypothetical protein